MIIEKIDRKSGKGGYGKKNLCQVASTPMIGVMDMVIWQRLTVVVISVSLFKGVATAKAKWVSLMEISTPEIGKEVDAPAMDSIFSPTETGDFSYAFSTSLCNQ